MAYDDDDDLDISVGRRGRRGSEDIPPNYLTQAILVTLFCCVPFGIVAIIQAARVNGLIAEGDYDGARRASDGAKTWCIVSLVAGLIAGFGGCAVQMMANANRGF